MSCEIQGPLVSHLFPQPCVTKGLLFVRYCDECLRCDEDPGPFHLIGETGIYKAKLMKKIQCGATLVGSVREGLYRCDFQAKIQ